MNENKLKNFLVNGFQALEDRSADQEEEVIVEQEDVAEPLYAEEADDAVYVEEEYIEPPVSEAVTSALKDVESELLKVRYILEGIRDAEPAAPDMSDYLTNREQLKSIIAAIERKDTELSNKALVRAMEQISVMREDFFKLCQGMRGRIDRMSAEDVLSSFEAYSVDMENILSDGGVFIGPFPFDRLNTLHQRIIDVVPTDDEEKNGTIAERLSDGYKLGNKILLKEKVKIYKFTEAGKAEETPSETTCETNSETENKTENQEEEE